MAVATALLASGCSTGEIKIDQKKAEGLAQRIGNSGTVKLRSAHCPSGIKAKKGADFDCNLVYADGTKATITMHQLDDKGRIRTSGADIHVTQ
jgi:hypothetical protein